MSRLSFPRWPDVEKPDGNLKVVDVHLVVVQLDVALDPGVEVILLCGGEEL